MTTYENWTKHFSGDWDDGADWSGGARPDDDISVGLTHFSKPYTVTSSNANSAFGLDIFAGATLDIASGVFTDHSFFVSGGIVKVEQGAEFDAGFLGNGQGYGNGGKFELFGGTFRVLDSYFGFNDGGQLLLSNEASNLITGGTSAQTSQIVNARQTISGAGEIGGAFLKFVNGHFGIVDATGSVQLLISTGIETDNAGLIESTNTGGLLITGGIDNQGELKSSKGLLEVTGNVDGAGILEIARAGQIELGGYAYQDVQFQAGATGTLILDHGDINPVNEIYGAVAGVHFDLRDIIDNGATKPSFTIAGSHEEYTLTVTDGTHTADLYLIGGVGAYKTKSFTLGLDGHGGTLVTVV